MAIEQTQPTFRTSDGREFDTHELAQRHEDLFVAHRDFEASKQTFYVALCKTQHTRDGQLFEFGWDDYYFVEPGWSRMPVLVEVSFSQWNFELDADTLTLIQEDGDDNKRRYQINTLYRDEKCARIALVAAQRKWIEERIEEAAQTARKLGLEPPRSVSDEMLELAEALLEPMESLLVGVVPEWDEQIEKLRAIVARVKEKNNG